MNLLILIFFGSSLVVGQTINLNSKNAGAVHGEETQSPYIASVLAKDSYTEVWTRFCVGTIINQYSVLVTAKCAGFCRNPLLCKLVVGSAVINGTNVAVIGSVFHSSYSPSSFHVTPFDILDEEDDLKIIDIGIIHSEKIPYALDVYAATMPTKPIKPNYPVGVLGWGPFAVFRWMRQRVDNCTKEPSNPKVCSNGAHEGFGCYDQGAPLISLIIGDDFELIAISSKDVSVWCNKENSSFTLIFPHLNWINSHLFHSGTEELCSGTIQLNTIHSLLLLFFNCIIVISYLLS